MNARLFARYIVRETMGLFFMGAALFLAAGTVDWWTAWAVLALTAAWIAGTAAVILRYSPNLLAERLGPRRGAKGWDGAILSSLGLAQLARYVVAGMDMRYNWPGSFPLAAQIAALVVCALGYALFVWATRSNAFFSQLVRIQSERGHAVVTGGPYHYLRHPGYLGGILFEIAAPIALGSTWALVPSLIGAVLLVLRTALEDRTLQKELSGYSDYSREVHHRLVPGVW